MAEDTRLTLQEIFDADYYRVYNPDLANLSDDEALFHFQLYGLGEIAGNPNRGKFSPFLDLSYYRSNNTDIALGTLLDRQILQQVLDVGIAEARPISPYVDLSIYRANNTDLAGYDNNQLFRHLINSGVEEGRRFSALFDTASYRQGNPDLSGLSNRELWEHFVSYGLSEGRSFSQFFDLQFYKDNNADLATEENTELGPNPTNADYFNHFISTGLAAGRKFSPYFDVDYYLNNNADLSRAFGFNTNPGQARRLAYQHFQRSGLDEGRRFARDFDVNYYLNNEPDLRAVGLNRRQAVSHFINFGLNEGRRASLTYDPQYYLANNPDLVAAGFNNTQAFRHFETTGFNEGRSASVFFDPDAIASLVVSTLPADDPAESIGEWISTGNKWAVPPGGTITFSFVTSSTAFTYEGQETGVSEVPTAVKNNVRNIMRLYSQYLPFNIVEVQDRPPNVGQLRIMFSNGRSDVRLDEGTYAYAYFPGNFTLNDAENPVLGGSNQGGDIHLNRNRSVIDFAAGPGSFAYETLIHEIGHALGLKHPFSNGPILSTREDNNTNTVMTYNDDPSLYSGSFALTPMSYDIRALQTLYGASYTNNGDTVYSLNTGNFIGQGETNSQNGIKQTLWDGGGIDTFDFSALPPNLGGYYFDMNEGGQNTTQFALNGATYLILNPDSTPTDPIPPDVYTTNSFGTTIAYGFELENLLGSQGDDEIVGNSLSNNINGAAGNDQITGAGGADILTGNVGRDIFVVSRGDGSLNPANADVITDFTDGQDLIGLSFGLALPEVYVTPGANPNDTYIRAGGSGEYLVLLIGVPTSALNSADFTFV